MKSSLSQSDPVPKARARGLDSFARKLLLAQLGRLSVGELVLADEKIHRFGSRTPDFPISVTVDVRDPGFYGDIVFGGTVGAGEAYMAGLWDCSNLTGLVRVMLRNRHVLDGMDGGFSLVSAPLRRLLHALNRNTRSGSRRNIAAHYNLGNDFFRLFLDETMMYSAALFESPNTPLKDASMAKLDLICRKLDLRPGDHVVEIGSGWGGFAMHAASRYGCAVTTTTISRNQFEFARERIRKAGLEDRVTLLLEDYRELKGHYDKLVSIEMIEAIGHQYYDAFFRKCASLLKPDGIMMLQAITLKDQFYRRARNEVDFIKRHIFPGSCIPAISPLLEAATRSSDLKLVDLEDIGPHYATTLRLWRENFLSRADDARAMGYSESFIRMWEFYFAYCEGGYDERDLGDAQMIFTKPLWRPAASGG